MPHDNQSKKGPSSPERRLLEAMVTLNAINNGRPVPDMHRTRIERLARVCLTGFEAEQLHHPDEVDPDGSREDFSDVVLDKGALAARNIWEIAGAAPIDQRFLPESLQ